MGDDKMRRNTKYSKIDPLSRKFNIGKQHYTKCEQQQIPNIIIYTKKSSCTVCWDWITYSFENRTKLEKHQSYFNNAILELFNFYNETGKAKLKNSYWGEIIKLPYGNAVDIASDIYDLFDSIVNDCDRYDKKYQQQIWED